jgi:hypothetical protein
MVPWYFSRKSKISWNVLVNSFLFESVNRIHTIEFLRHASSILYVALEKVGPTDITLTPASL